MDIRKNFYKLVRKDLFTFQRNERIHEMNGRILQIIHIVFNIFRVGSYDRAVIMIDGSFEFISLVRDAWIEDELHVMLQKPFDMPVRDLGRIAGGIARDRFDSEFVDPSGGNRRKYDFVAQFGKESMPERVVFVHVQYARDADLSPDCLVGCQGLVVK